MYQYIATFLVLDMVFKMKISNHTAAANSTHNGTLKKFITAINTLSNFVKIY